MTVYIAVSVSENWIL